MHPDSNLFDITRLGYSLAGRRSTASDVATIFIRRAGGQPHVFTCYLVWQSDRWVKSSAPYHDSVVRRTAFRGFRLGVGCAVMLEHHKRRATTTGGPLSAARRVTFPASSGRRERSPMRRHRLRAPSYRANGKSDPTCHGIMIGSTSFLLGPNGRVDRSISMDAHELSVSATVESPGHAFEGAPLSFRSLDSSLLTSSDQHILLVARCGMPG